ncbi:type II toxin-antitoxin system HipA family toxin [Paraburkholderia fungorum]|uniref:type II toxin-antitoxin system HipA family toxin n=1 Tax=Paraburkholderia fungorum TaxID=134537 RepID=UPI00161B1914
MTTSIRYLRLYLHQPDGVRRPIGYLSAYGDILRVSFDPDYINDPQRPVLSYSYIGATDADTVATLKSQSDERIVRTGGKWPSFFQNLLPESHNRERLARERGCSEDDEFELLAAAGHDLMGAVEVEPVPPQEGIPDPVRLWHTALGLDVLEPGFVESPVEDAASIPGVVTKFSAIRDGRRYVVKRHGEAGSYILKLPTTRHPDLVEIEMTGFKLCQALELDCAWAEIVSRADAELPEHIPFDEVLAVKRFDRTEGGRRVHMEEFAQVLRYDPRAKYGRDLMIDYPAMLGTLDRFSARPAQDVKEFIRRFVAFILMGNCDAHLKNWALVYPDGRTPQLAPLYDPVPVTSFFAAASENDYALNRAIDQKLRALTWVDLEALFQKAGLRRVNHWVSVARATVVEAQRRWPAILATAPEAVRKSVTERLNGGVAIATPS